MNIRPIVFGSSQISRRVILILALLVFVIYADEPKDQLHRDLTFASVDGKDLKDLKLDIYMPAGIKNPNLVMYIHGGGWKAGSKNNCNVKYLTGYGYAVASISYRLTDVAIFPAQIHDCKAALRWLRANASDFGYNAERVVVAGSSAGGQLAALMATSGGVKELEGNLGIHLEESSRVQGAIDFFGATDFVLRSKTQPHRANAKGSVVYLYFGGGADEKVALAKLASAAYQVTSDDPPLLVFHGDKDNTVLIDQSEKITEVYKKAQLPIEFYVLKGAGHGGKRFHGTETRDKILNFLNRIFKAE